MFDARVKVRPGAEIFLERMAKKYEVVIFTASLPEVR
jgi:TFIIF-interacting CTD phosphatase-like protein